MSVSEITVKLSPSAFEEVRSQLKIMPGHSKFKINGAIYVEVLAEPKPTPHASAAGRKKLRAGKPAL